MIVVIGAFVGILFANWNESRLESRREAIYRVADTREMQLVGIFQPYIVANLDDVGMLSRERGLPPSAAFDPTRIRTVLQIAEFRNTVAVKWDIVTDTRDVMIIALEEARLVEAPLAGELEPGTSWKSERTRSQ